MENKLNNTSRLPHIPIPTLEKESELLKKADKYLGILNKEYPELQLLANDEFEVTFALTKAEFSELTREEARYIYDNYKDTTLSAKEFFNTTSNEEGIQKQHDKVEYFNILKTIRYIRKDNRKLYNRVKKDGITSELLLELHVMLTDSLDELFLNKWVKHYSPYFQGTFRDKDNVVVGWMRPGRAANIPNVLDDINKRSKEVKTIEDIFIIHQDMYRAHLFFNGNKRICRCVEIILNNQYKFIKNIPFSVGNYFNHDRYLSALVWYCFRNYNYYWFAKYSYSLLSVVFIEKLYNVIFHELVLNWYTWGKDITEEIISEFLVKRTNNDKLFAKTRLIKDIKKGKLLSFYGSVIDICTWHFSLFDNRHYLFIPYKR